MQSNIIEKHHILNKTKHIAVIIMAAGSSSRLGTPKQLLKWKGKTLIESVIDTALELGVLKTVVVLGAAQERIHPVIKQLPVDIVYNKDWNQGLGNSIACGVQQIQKKKDVDGVLVVLGDQPNITKKYLQELIQAFEETDNKIIATSYPDEKTGVPVVFDKVFFKELSLLDGDKGAKQILDSYKSRIKLLDGSNLIADIDTNEDYKNLYKSNH